MSNQHTRFTVRGITIDGPAAKDLDDAVWVDVVDAGLRIDVTIAGVADGVPLDSELDLIARCCVVTRYVSSGNVPLFPHDLSEGSLSLLPNVERSTVTVRITMDDQLNVIDVQIIPSLLTSQAKLSYVEVSEICSDVTHPLHSQVQALAVLSRGLLNRRRAHGALANYDLTSGIVTSEEGLSVRLSDRRETVGHMLIAELMILANTEVARFAIDNDIPVLFRNHRARQAAPVRAEMLEDLAEAMGPRNEMSDALDERMQLVIGRAEYAAVVRGHYGLNLPSYLHFTSPIRRYVDLVNHRNILAHVRGEPLPFTQDQVAAIGESCNKALDYQRAERESQAMRMASRRATYAVESSKIESLTDKELDRALKVAVRATADCTDDFRAALIARLTSGTITVRGLSIALFGSPSGLNWDAIRREVIGVLVRHTEHATSLVTLAVAHHQWPVISFAMSRSHVIDLTTNVCVAQVEIGGVVKSSKRFATRTISLAQQRATIDLLAQHFGLPAPIFTDDEHSDNSTPASSGPLGFEPVSALLTVAAQRQVQPAGFSFKSTGPDHAPTVTCTCTLLHAVGVGVDRKKQEAKKKAATAVAKQLGLFQ